MLFEILVYHTSHQLSLKSVEQAVLTVEHTIKNITLIDKKLLKLNHLKKLGKLNCKTKKALVFLFLYFLFWSQGSRTTSSFSLAMQVKMLQNLINFKFLTQRCYIWLGIGYNHMKPDISIVILSYCLFATFFQQKNYKKNLLFFPCDLKTWFGSTI